MNCYIFPGREPAFPDICGTSLRLDLATHLRRCGIQAIYTELEGFGPGSLRMCYSEAEAFLGIEWLAVFDGILTRQDPGDLTRRKAGNAVSLGCSSEPWRHTTVLTAGSGAIERIIENPSPETAETNLCFSGMILVKEPSFDPERPFLNASAFHLHGYWRVPDSAGNYLLASHDILSGEVPHPPAEGPVVLKSAVPPSCEIRGTLWLETGCHVGENCMLENCVIMKGSRIGAGSFLRNCLLPHGSVIKSGSRLDDKYLTIMEKADG